MDFNNIPNACGNYILNSSQMMKMKNAGITNPSVSNMSNASYGLEPVYVMKKQDFAVNHYDAIKGEGGLGSGEELSKRFPNASPEELKKRRYAQIKNAQRKYRSKNREAYNEYMNKLYHTMAGEKKFIDGSPSDRFGKSTRERKTLPYDTIEGWNKYRIEKAQIANAKYRAKKRAMTQLSNIDKLVEKELKKKFKEEFKGKRGRPSKTKPKNVFSPDSEWYKENFKKLKIEMQEELEKKGNIVPYDIRQKKVDPDYPLGEYGIVDGEFKLIKEVDDKDVGDRKEYDINAVEYKKKREKAKAPPVVSEKKKKSPFEPTENIKMTIEEKVAPEKKEKDKVLWINENKFTGEKTETTFKDLTKGQKEIYKYLVETGRPVNKNNVVLNEELFRMSLPFKAWQSNQ